MTIRAIYSSWQSARVERIILFIFATSISLLVYGLTLVHEAEIADAAELALQAYQLGVTHPPGYPVYILLGHLFTRFISEPALATNVLSAVCASLTVGVTSLLVFEITGGVLASLIVPLVLAFSHKMWAAAISTEVYDVNLLLFALALYFVIHWRKAESRTALIAAAVIFGMSLGTYLANLLMLPAFLVFLLRTSKQKWIDSITLVAITSAIGLLIAGYTMFRARTVVPMGTEALPTTLLAALAYFSGKQYGTTRLQDAQFYLSRLEEHTQIFSYSFLYIGTLFGVVGFMAARS